MKHVKIQKLNLLAFILIFATLILGSTWRPARAEQLTTSYGYTYTIGDTSWDSWATPQYIKHDLNNNIYLSGYFYGTIDFDPSAGVDNHTSPRDAAYLTKLNADGSYGWTKVFSGDNSLTSRGLAVTDSGKIYTAVRFMGEADLNPDITVNNVTSGGNFDTAIIILNADGSYNDALIFKGSTGASTLSNELVVDDNNNVYAVGKFSGTVDFDSSAAVDNKTSAGSTDNAFITKLNADGSYGWTKTINSSNGISAMIDSADSFYVTGDFSGTVDFDPSAGLDSRTSSNSGSDQNMFITKFNTDGSYVWTKTVNGADNQKSLSIDSSGAVYVGGKFSGTVDFDPSAAADNKTSAGSTDTFITKLNADGSYGWTKIFGSTSFDGASSLVVSGSDIYISGYFNGTVDFDPSTGIDTKLGSTSANAFVTKLKTDGSYVLTYTPSTNDGAYTYGIMAMTVDETGNIYYADVYGGGTVDFNPFAGTDIRSTAYENIFISKINQNYLHQISGVPAGISVSTPSDSDASDNTIPRGTTTTISLQKSGIPLADVQADFTSDLDWSAVTADSNIELGKAFVHNLTNVAGAANTFTLYVPKLAGSNAVGICPGASSLAELNPSCSGLKYYVLGKSSELSVVKIGGIDYWKITGLTGTGGFSTTVAASVSDPSNSNGSNSGDLAETGISQIGTLSIAGGLVFISSLLLVIIRKKRTL